MPEEIVTDSAPAGTSETPAAAAPAPAPAAPTETTATPEAKGPEDWAAARTRIANGDEKVLQRLNRYSTQDEFIKAGLEAQNKIGAIKTRAPLTKDSTPEEVSAYRKANDIPEAPADYKIAMPDGLVLGEQDKVVAGKFQEIAHKHNLPTAAVNEIIAGQMKIQNEMIAEQQAADNLGLQEAQAALGSPEVWGSEVKLNLNLINGMLDSAPAGVKDQLLGARLADGSLLGNNVDTLKWLSTMARELNPYATVTPGGNGNSQTIDTEMAELQKLMGDRKSDYWVGPLAAAKQERFRALATAQEAGGRRK